MLRFVQIDSFTNAPFGGNPAVVFEPGGPIAEGVMQAIAAEMNVSETTFLEGEGGRYQVSIRGGSSVYAWTACGYGLEGRRSQFFREK